VWVGACAGSQLDLPDYKDQDVFVEKLMTAIQECGSFDRV
jgi:hypothetical protein